MLPAGHVFETGSEETGMSYALWLPAGVPWNDLEWEQWASRHEKQLSCHRAYEQFHKLEDWFDYERAKQTGGMGQNPTYWLVALCTEERARGRGQASTLLRHGLSLADQAHAVASIETALESNVRLYQKHGFEVHHCAEFPDADGNWRMWFMRREKR